MKGGWKPGEKETYAWGNERGGYQTTRTYACEKGKGGGVVSVGAEAEFRF